MCSLQIGQNDKAKEKKTQSNKVGSSTSIINKQLLSYIEWCLLGVRGNPTMKSFTTLSHFHSTISKGWSISTSFWCSILAYWQTKQVATYSATCFILGHKYILLRSWNIFVTLGCILNLLLWASSRIVFLIGRSHTNPIFKPYHSVNTLMKFCRLVSLNSFFCSRHWSALSLPEISLSTRWWRWSYSSWVTLESIPTTSSNPWIVLSIQDYLFNHHC